MLRALRYTVCFGFLRKIHPSETTALHAPSNAAWRSKPLADEDNAANQSPRNHLKTVRTIKLPERRSIRTLLFQSVPLHPGRA